MGGLFWQHFLVFRMMFSALQNYWLKDVFFFGEGGMFEFTVDSDEDWGSSTSSSLVNIN